MGIIKNYKDGLVVAAVRYNQFTPRNLSPYELLNKKLIGYVFLNGMYFVVFWDNDKYYRSFFAKNVLWFEALTSEPQFACIKELPQLLLI